MPFPVIPSEIKSLIASPGGSFCEKFIRSLKLPFYVWKNAAFAIGEDGKITKEFAAMICELNCKGTTGTEPGAPVISASDGAFLDKVQITWTGIAGATSYEVFRNTTNTTATAVSLGSTASLSFDDTTATVGTVYYYWVRAKVGATIGPFSAVDTGFAANALDAVTNLDATKGFSHIQNWNVSLVWTSVTGASSWDIYRNTVDDFATATRIDADRVPFDNSETLSSGPTPIFINNGDELVYLDNPPNDDTTYYYWVVPKANAAIGAASNSATGWVAGYGDGSTYASGLLQVGITQTLNVSGYSEARMVLFGGGGNGAGAGGLRGGGGAGAGGTVYGVYPITGATPTFRITSTPAVLPPRSTSEVDGTPVPLTILEFAPDGVAFTTILTSNAGLVTPDYSNSSNGVGGDGTGGIIGSGVTNSGIKFGRAGKPANGNKGGRSGYRFGGFGLPGAHYDAALHGSSSYNGDGVAGSGSYANGAAVLVRDGGLGQFGYAVLFLKL